MTEQEWLDIFSDNLRDILQEYGYSQREFAEAIGVTEVTVSRYINRQRMPTIKTLINMSMELGLDLEEFANFGERID